MSVYIEVQVPAVTCPYCREESPLAADETHLLREGRPVKQIRECPSCSGEFVLKAWCKVDISYQALKIEGAVA